MDIWLNLFLGVLAGVLTYILIEVIRKIFRELIVPWIQKEVYRGHSIQAEWYGYNATVLDTGEYIEDAESESTIILKQQGNKISGELLLTKQPNGTDIRKVFQLEGSFVDTILVLNTKVKNSNNMGTGSIILKLTEDGSKLKGKHTFISSYDWTTVGVRNQVWKRRTS